MPPKLVFEDSESEDEVVLESSPRDSRTEELELNCMELHDQILHRPDTYIGSVKRVKHTDQLWSFSEDKFVQSKPTYSEGLLRIFVEIMSNAIDNVWRSREFGIKCNSIRVTIDEKSGETSVWNDGKDIPISVHKKENRYVPELIFGRLLSSTNYDDSESRKTSGRNGYGAKLTNLFSKKFSVEVCSNKSKKIYTQTWSDNMRVRQEPVIKPSKNTSYTLVSWIPDFKRFDNMTGYDSDIIGLYKKYIYDTAMIVSKYGVKVYINNTHVEMSGLSDYAQLYLPKTEDSEEDESDNEDEEKKEKGDKQEIISFKTVDSRVVVIPFNRHLSVSFVNGICTTEGGVHDDAWCETIFRPILDKINGKKEEKDDKKKTKTQAEKDKEKKKREKEKKENYKLDIEDIYRHFAIFIDVEVTNPEFRGQNKTKLSAPAVTTAIKPTEINKMMKWRVIESIRHMIELREMGELKIKTRGFTKVEGLEDANFAKKPSKRSDCILCVTEGLSAKTYVVAGMKYGLRNKHGKVVSGRDYIGALPIRGKFINPQGRSMKSVAANKEVRALAQGLGLQVGVDYTIEENLKNLRYGSVYVFADADDDGIHIIGLLFNFLYTIYPSILKTDYFYFVRTPIMKIGSGKNIFTFYSLPFAKNYIENNKIKSNVKYFKGLGTSSNKDIATDFGKRIVQLKATDKTDDVITNTFNKKKSDYRKKWLTSFNPSTIEYKEGLDNVIEVLNIEKFINEEFVNFSIEDCKRSLPNIFDGLKESQRKILYSVFKKKLKYESKKSLKVAQLSGYVAEHTNYHHGEDNLIDTIKNMAQRFVGSNNMPFFFNDGMFGSRLENGDDGASGRYLFTKQEYYIRDVFPECDDKYLENVEDDGDIVEKKYYVPVIPMVLINGCIGIGTGFATRIPSYNPETIIKWIRTWNAGGENYPDLIPWYRNFKGEIKLVDGKVYTYGVLQPLGKGKYRVSEIPIGKNNLSISKFRSKLEDLVEKKVIKDFDDHSDDNKVDFVIIEDTDGMKLTLESLNLVDIVHTTNMVMFSGDTTIKKYNTVEDILQEFCKERLAMYHKRRAGEISVLQHKIKVLTNKIKFINEINLSTPEKLVLQNKDDNELLAEMERRGYDKVEKKKKLKKKNDEEENDENESDNEDEENKEQDEKEEEKLGIKGYDYLFDMKIRIYTAKKMAELINERESLQEDLRILNTKTEKQLWEDELCIIEKKYQEWNKIEQARSN